jgi:hypothetical protein
MLSVNTPGPRASPAELALDPVTIAQAGLQAIDQTQEWDSRWFEPVRRGQPEI